MWKHVLIALAFLASMPVAAEAAASMGSTRFVTAVANAGTFEVEASRIALERSQNADVKAFAQQMAADHAKLGEALRAAAGDIPLPAKLDARHETLLAELKASPAEAFDGTYVRQQLMAHKEAEVAFRAEGMKGDDPRLKVFATETLPTIQHHLEMAEALRKAQSD
jgi:putative membrane protein